MCDCMSLVKVKIYKSAASPKSIGSSVYKKYKSTKYLSVSKDFGPVNTY